ncbi:MAG TPA: c-type cytochrome [Bryobacteraceae bacterium]|nr:c-type cytochrome [Bryobacteraceae bacterium]
MNRVVLLATLSVSVCVLTAGTAPDARRGAEFFRTQLCVNCHAVDGHGGDQAPDLAQRLDRNYTPAGIASRMWDHAPVMWQAITQQKLPLPSINAGQAADLFAFFYSVRYFEKPGEAERGRRIFQSKHCSDCHSLTSGSSAPGTPVERWESLADPTVLVERMWNHSDLMKGELANRRIQWPQLTARDLQDLLVYLQNLPQTRGAKLAFMLPSPEGGEALFKEKGCANCHKGALALEYRLGDSTLTGVAAAMWNHNPQMQKPHPQLTLPEMRQLLGYVWAKQFFYTPGDAARGHRIFESKKCATCHNNASSGAPALGKPSEAYSAITMVAVLWKHGPSMLEKMRERHIPWPQLSETEMANLIAYLNSR